MTLSMAEPIGERRTILVYALQNELDSLHQLMNLNIRRVLTYSLFDRNPLEERLNHRRQGFFRRR